MSTDFCDAYEARIAIKIPPDGREVDIRVLPIGERPSLMTWIRRILRRRHYTAVWFLRRMQSGKLRQVTEAIEHFWIAVDQPELKYLTPAETINLINDFFAGARWMSERTEREKKIIERMQADTTVDNSHTDDSSP